MYYMMFTDEVPVSITCKNVYLSDAQCIVVLLYIHNKYYIRHIAMMLTFVVQAACSIAAFHP